MAPEFNALDPSGLYGLFRHHNAAYLHQKGQLKELFKDAEETVVTILDAPEFKVYVQYLEGAAEKVRALIAPSLEPIIRGDITRRAHALLWSVPERFGASNLALVLAFGWEKGIATKRLHLCVTETTYGGIHWYRTFNDQQKLEVDSIRLLNVLTVLANARTAWAYLRAHVHSIERSPDMYQ